jgi:hypothetical protein
MKVRHAIPEETAAPCLRRQEQVRNSLLRHAMGRDAASQLSDREYLIGRGPIRAVKFSL